MKRILDNCSRRFNYDGWAILIDGTSAPLSWTFCTTRAEAREIHRELNPDMFARTSIVKAKINIEVVDERP